MTQSARRHARNQRQKHNCKNIFEKLLHNSKKTLNFAAQKRGDAHCESAEFAHGAPRGATAVLGV